VNEMGLDLPGGGLIHVPVIVTRFATGMLFVSGVVMASAGGFVFITHEEVLRADVFEALSIALSFIKYLVPSVKVPVLVT
jgi:hypothetical protein